MDIAYVEIVVMYRSGNSKRYGLNNYLEAIDFLQNQLNDKPNVIEKLCNHIVEQRNKSHYLNALVATAEINSILLKEFSDFQKRIK